MYNTRIGSSSIPHYRFAYGDQHTHETIEVCVATAPITAVQSVELLVNGSAINVNVEMAKGQYGRENHEAILTAALAPELIDGAVVIDSSTAWVPDSHLTDPNNVVVSARIDITDALRRLLLR